MSKFYRFCLFKPNLDPKIGRVLRISTSARKNNLILPKTYQAKYQLIDYFKDHIIFKNNDYIACLKPYGVENDLPKNRDESEENESNSATENSENAEDIHELRMGHVLPLLSELLGEPELLLAKTVPWNCAGIALFATNEDAYNRVHQAHKAALSKRLPYMKLLCICVGIPDSMEGEEEVHIEKETSNGVNLFIVGSGEYSKRQISRQICSRFPVRYKTLATSRDFSLVEIHTLSLSWHCPRLFLMSKGAPILGDDYYQQRVARVLGKTVMVDPKNADRKNQYIPVDFLKSAGLSLRDYHSLPTYCVVHEMLLLNVLRSPSDKNQQIVKRNLYLKRSLPDYFGALLQLLFPDFAKKYDFE